MKNADLKKGKSPLPQHSSAATSGSSPSVSAPAARPVAIAEKDHCGDDLFRLAAIVKYSDDAILGMNLDGVIFTWNKASERIFGHAGKDLKGLHFSTLIPPNRRGELNDVMDRVRRGEHAEAFEARRILKDGSPLYVSTAISPFKDANGMIAGASVIARDVTQARHSEEAFAKERSLLLTVVNNLPDHIYVKDNAGRYIMDNPAHRAFIGVKSPEDVVGKTVFSFFPKTLADRYHTDDIAIMRSGEPILNREEPTVTRSKQKCWLSTTKIPFRDGKGEIAGLVCLGRDITRSKAAEGAGLSVPEDKPSTSVSNPKPPNASSVEKSRLCRIRWRCHSSVHSKGMSYIVSSFVSIVRCVSDDRVHCEEESRIEELFSEEFDDLDFELVLCAFEATHKMAFSRKLSELTLDDYGHLSIEDFLEEFVDPAEQRDPLFITNTLLMFRTALENALLPPEQEQDFLG